MVDNPNNMTVNAGSVNLENYNTLQMNWLAKINLRVAMQRLGAFRSALLLLALVGICLYSGYRIGNFYHNYQQQMLHKQEARLQQLYQQQEDNVRQINMLQVELEVEKLANQRALTSLKQMEAEHYQVKKQLAFYEKVMAPEKQADGIVIDSVSVSATESLNHYRFQVVLVQQEKKKRYAKGYVQLALLGSANDKPARVELGDISALTEQDMAFNFRYFQIVEGEFTLPANFVPEQMELAVILPKGKWQKYHRLDENYAWQQITKPEQQVAQQDE